MHDLNIDKLLKPAGVLCVAAMALLLGCQGGGGSATLPADAPAVSGFELDIDPETFIEGGGAAGFKLSTETAGDELLVSIAVEGADNLKALMFGLEYDPQYCSPQAITMTGALDPSGGEVIEIPELLQSRAGRVEYAQMLPWPGQRDGLDGDAVLAVARFRLEPDLAVKSSLSVPVNRRSQAILNWDEETGVLSWYHSHSGDFNQDGYVVVNDLTSIGQNWKRTTGGGPWPVSDAVSIVDYDSNGEINNADMAGICRCWGTSTMECDVYTSLSADDYPAGGMDPNGPGAELLGNVSIGDAIQESGEDRKRFEFTVESLQPGAYYWVRPGGGTPSTLVGGPAVP